MIITMLVWVQVPIKQVRVMIIIIVVHHYDDNLPIYLVDDKFTLIFDYSFDSN